MALWAAVTRTTGISAQLGLALSVVPLGCTPLMERSRIRPEAHQGELLTFIRVFAPKAEKNYETATDDFDQGVPPP